MCPISNSNTTMLYQLSEEFVDNCIACYVIFMVIIILINIFTKIDRKGKVRFIALYNENTKYIKYYYPKFVNHLINIHHNLEENPDEIRDYKSYAYYNQEKEIVFVSKNYFENCYTYTSTNKLNKKITVEQKIRLFTDIIETYEYFSTNYNKFKIYDFTDEFICHIAFVCNFENNIFKDIHNSCLEKSGLNQKKFINIINENPEKLNEYYDAFQEQSVELHKKYASAFLNYM